ncbi:MAG: 5-formyltetrahydrofolate cyclo-ligase, partial [Carboxylicivirga sp.]|nr:5-formyltetrahydrofolate cyclo-ligase [Carboxylicivirga sp.]
MKISLVQFAPQLGQLQQNLNQIKDLIQTSDGQLFVLPELANSGYNFKNREEALGAAEKIENSIFLTELVKIAKDKNCLIVSGFCEREGGQLFNSAVLLGSNGVIGCYRKLHLFLNEKDIFTPGNL